MDGRKPSPPFSNCPKKDPKMAKDDKKVHTGAPSVEILLQKYNENYEEGPRWRRQRRVTVRKLSQKPVLQIGSDLRQCQNTHFNK